MQLWISIFQLQIFIIAHIETIAFSTITLNAIMDNHGWIIDIHSWIMDVHNKNLDIYNSRMLWIAISELWIFMIDYVYT